MTFTADEALDQAPCGFVRSDEHGAILRVNARLCSMLDRGVAELEEQPLSGIFDGPSRLFYQTYLLPMLRLQGEVHEIQLSLLPGKGEALPVLMNARKFEQDGTVAYDLVFMRMSLRSRYEDELLRSKKVADEANAAKEEVLAQLSLTTELLKAATHLAGLAVCTIDYEAGTVQLPKEGAELFGCGTEGITVPRSALHALFHPDDRPQLEGAIAAALDPAGPGLFSMEHRIMLPSGQVRWLNARKHVQFDRQPTPPVPKSAVFVAKDITARKHLERAMHLQNKRKDEFLATVAHELRGPLSPLVNGLELLEYELQRVPALVPVHGLMKRQVDQMTRLVGDLLDVNRINQGKIELRLEPMDLSEVLHAATETTRALVEQRQHELTVVTATGPWAMNGDAMRLMQVFSNLLINSAKYTPPGGRIELTLHREADEAVVQVKDNGIGIPEQDLINVFDLFTQVERTTEATVAGGLGIGLNIVRQLVHLHGGSVSAHSEGLGKGTMFMVRLPLTSA